MPNKDPSGSKQEFGGILFLSGSISLMLNTINTVFKLSTKADKPLHTPVPAPRRSGSSHPLHPGLPCHHTRV